MSYKDTCCEYYGVDPKEWNEVIAELKNSTDPRDIQIVKQSKRDLDNLCAGCRNFGESSCEGSGERLAAYGDYLLDAQRDN